MFRKFLKYSLLLFTFLFAGIFVFYFFKVYSLKEPIIIDNFFSENKRKIKSFLANKFNINENQIAIEDVGLEINDLQNFLSVKISNLEIVSEQNETILKSNKINVRLSFIDLIEGLTNNNNVLLKNMFIDKVEFEYSNMKNFKIINSSLLKFIQGFDRESSNFFKNLKINQFNFKFLDQNSILKSNLLFECKSLNFDVLGNKKEFFLKCYETKTNSGVILKNFHYDKNDIFIDGYFEKFNLSLLKFKNHFKKFNFEGELSSYFKLDLNPNLNVNKFKFKILNNSSLMKIVNGKPNQFKLNGLGSYDFINKTLSFKNFLLNKYVFNGDIVKSDTSLKSNLKISFDKNKFDHFDVYMYEVFIKKLLSKNKNLLIFNNKFSFYNIKSELLINTTFDIKNKQFKNTSINSKGYYSSFIENKQIDDLLVNLQT